jgi:hypothetical protein
MLSVSLKMEKFQYCTVIKLFVKESLTPNETHSKLIKVYGDSSPSFSTIKKWAADFKPLPLLFKSLLSGQEDCVFCSGHLN